MLTTEMLRQNSVLAGLTDAQFAVIAEMSKNDENTVIGTKIGALHGQYDSDILGITGVAKKDGEKSYDYAKRVLNDFKGKAESVKTVQGELNTYKAKVTDLEAKIASGAGNETLVQQLKDAKNQVSQLQTSLKAKETELATEKEKYETNLRNTHVDYAFNAATAGLKFKAGITEPVQKTLLNAAKAEVLAKGTPEMVEGHLVIRGADGMILNNPKNSLKPYTIEELVMETSLKDIIDTGKQQPGGGTGPNKPKGGNGLLDLSGVKNQVEADTTIEHYLLANGLTRDSHEFSEQAMQLRTDNNVADLPLR